MRKNYIASLEARTQEEIAEEEALFIELKRLEQNERKFRKERDELLRTLLGIDSGLPDIVAEEEGPASITIDNIKKKKKGTVDTDVPSTPTHAIALGAAVPKRTQTTKSAVYGELAVFRRQRFFTIHSDEKSCLLRVDPPATTTTKTTHVPVHLRSFKLPIPKAAIAPKVIQILSEVGISPSRLVMPTRDNCAKSEAVLESTTTLLEVKKVVDKVDQDIRVLRARLGLRESEGVEGDVEESTSIDVDESKDDGGASREGEVDGRAQSVVSGRGRKQVSVSISSMANWVTRISHVDRCRYLQSTHPRPLELGRRDRKEGKLFEIYLHTSYLDGKQR